MINTLLISAATTLATLLALKRHAGRLGLVEHPHGHRTHDAPTPVVGGLGMAIGLSVTWLFSERADPGAAIAFGALALVALGLWDDRHGMRARYKFIAQGLIVTTALLLDDSLLSRLGQLLPGLDLRLSLAALPFTVFAMLGLINAINMMDGLDGLAGKVALTSFGWIAFCMALLGNSQQLAFNLAIIGAIAAFLAFNARVPGRARAHLFMGDAGSMLLGYLLAWSAIDATQHRHAIPAVTALWICALPILDTAAVTIGRMLDGKRPSRAARDHLHHLLRATGMRVGCVSLCEAGLAAALGGIGVAGWRLGVPDWQMFSLFIAVAFAYQQACRIAWQAIRSREAVAERAPEPAMQESSV